jgi:hypothetical protein
MNKTLLYTLILLLLTVGIYFFIFDTKDNSYSSDEAGFTVKDTGSIGKLFLVSNKGESILAERTDSGWMINKKYHALPSALNLVLITLNEQAALYPVTKNAYDNVIKGMAADAIKVEIYDRAGKKMKVIYVGGTSVNNSGTNMMLEGHQPYVVQVPGFNGYLTSRFTTNLKDWRDRTVFNIPASEIKSVSIQYPEKPFNNFEIKRENGTLVIKSDTTVTAGLDGPNMHRANLFLDYFTNINCEGFLNGLPDNDTTIKTAPKRSTIEVTGMHGQHQLVDVYWMALNKRSKNVTSADHDVPDDYDADRLYAVINNYKDTVMIQQFVFGKIFRKSYEFFQKDGARPPKQAVPLSVLPKNGK